MSDKLALFLPSLRVGGAERVVLNLARGLSERNFSVDLVLQKAKGSFLSQVPPRVRLIDLEAHRMAFAIFPLSAYLRRERPKALLSSVMHTNIVALLANKLAGTRTRIVISEHNTLGISCQNNPNWRGRFLPFIAKRVYPWSDGIVAVSAGVADDTARMLSLPRNRIKVIYNPVITPELVAKTRETVDHPWFQDDNVPVILGVGRLTIQKDFVTLLRAFVLVRRRRLAKLVIIGEGEERANLEALVKKLGIAEDVDLPGFAENPYKYMASASVFVLSSQWEGLPTVLVEALATGVPLVSTDCESGPREILRNGQFGRLVPVGDVIQMARAIEATLNQPKNQLSVAAWQPFTLDSVAEQYLCVLINGAGSK